MAHWVLSEVDSEKKVPVGMLMTETASNGTPLACVDTSTKAQSVLKTVLLL